MSLFLWWSQVSAVRTGKTQPRASVQISRQKHPSRDTGVPRPYKCLQGLPVLQGRFLSLCAMQEYVPYQTAVLGAAEPSGSLSCADNAVWQWNGWWNLRLSLQLEGSVVITALGFLKADEWQGLGERANCATSNDQRLCCVWSRPPCGAASPALAWAPWACVVVISWGLRRTIFPLSLCMQKAIRLKPRLMCTWMRVVSVTIDALWASLCARVVKFPWAFDACVVLNPQNSVLVWFVAAVSYVEVSSVFSWELGGLLINMSGHETSEDQLKVCRSLALGAEAVLWG